jgi:putative phage-type endonuclease
MSEENIIDIRVQKLLIIPQFEQRSTQWFAQRNERLTASDVDAVLGNNPYAKPFEILMKKCGHKRKFVENDATRHGQKYENEAIDLYCKKYNKVSLSFGLLPHPTIDFLGGSPDDITIDGILLEVKCPLRRKIKMGEIPSYYMGQVQLNLEICNLEIAHFIEYRPASMNEDNQPILNVVEIKRDREWFARSLPVFKEFWDNVLHYREIGIEKHPKYRRPSVDLSTSPPVNKPNFDINFETDSSDDEDHTVVDIKSVLSTTSDTKVFTECLVSEL